MSPHRPLPLALLLLALAPAGARAHSVADEVSIGNTAPTPTQPTTGFVSDMLRGGLDLSDAVTLRLALGLTYDEPTSRRPGTHFRDSGGNIFTSALGLDWELSDHFDTSFELDYSPDNRRPQTYDSSLQFTGANGQSTEIDALIAAINGSKGAMVSFGYTTAGDSNWENAIDVGATYTNFDTRQTLAEAEVNVGGKLEPVTRAQIITLCANPTNARMAYTCRALKPALRADSASLQELQLRAAWTETFFVDTDVTLSGSYYLYDTDPTQVGYFSKLALGRTHVSLGNGLPIAPVLWSVRPDVSHRFGGFLVDLWYNYNQFYGTEGYGHSIGLKLQYKLAKGLKVWASGTIEDDIQPEEVGTSTATSPTTSSISSALTFGLKYSW